MNEGGIIPLLVAAKGSHVDIMKLLLNYGADINKPEPTLGKSALLASAELGLTEVVQVLIDYNAIVNYKSHITGLTALMLASMNGHQGTIITLLNNYADINLIDHKSWNALMHASKKGNRDILLNAIIYITPYAKVNLIPWYINQLIQLFIYIYIDIY